MNEKYIINFSSLDSLKEKFENDKKNFTNSSYSTFSSSYVKKCSDYNIQQMSNQLDKLYLKIKESYEKMEKWLIEYINNTKGIEAKLSNKSGYSQISDSSLISQINNIKKLPTVTYDVKSSFNVKKSNNNAFSSTLETRNKVTTPSENFKKEQKINIDRKLYSDKYIYDEFLVNKYKEYEKQHPDEEIEDISANLESMKNIIPGIDYIQKSTKNTKKIIIYGSNDGIKISCGDKNSFIKCIMKNRISSKTHAHSSGGSSSATVESITSGEASGNFFEQYISFGATWSMSIFEGIGKAAEGIFDLGVSLGTGTARLIDGKYGAVRDKYTKVSNGETTTSFEEWLDDYKQFANANGFEFEYVDDGYYENAMKIENLANLTKKEHVKELFDSFYETDIGKSIKSKSSIYDQTRAVGSSVGYTLPSILLTIATGGAGATQLVATGAGATSMAVTSSGTHIEGALNDGAGYGDATKVGILNGILDGASYFAGSNVSQVSSKIFSSVSNNVARKILVSATNVAFDVTDGASSALTEPLLKTLYMDGYTDQKTGEYIKFSDDENFFDRLKKTFESTGGMESVKSNALVAGLLSSFSELTDLRSIFKKEKNDININNSNMADNNNLKSIEKNTDINLKNKPTVKAKITEISNKIESKAITIFARLKSNIDKYSYKSTNYFEGLNDEIRKNGLYHFTGEKNLDSIINSGKIKGSDIISSYGNSKSFFFYGVPDVGAYATNLDKLPLKTTAVKIQPDDSIINSSKLKVRYKADAAISYDGSFIASPSTKMEKVYFVLTEENGKYSYKAVSEDIYRNYENTQMGKELNKKISDKSFVNKIKNDYLYETAIKETNAKIFDSKKVNNEFSKFLNQIDFNKNNLIESIIKNIPVDADDITKMRAIYLKLNQSVTYSDSFFTSNYFRLHTNSESFLSEVKGWYYKKTDVSNVVNSNVVCSDWSRMYSELLEMSGIDKNRISIRTTTNAELTHNYVVVDFGDKVLIADGTENIIGRTDLANSKYGLQTGGFIIASKDEFYSGLNQQGYKKTVEELSAKSQLSINGKDISEVDKEIGYSESQYNKDFNDLISTYSSTTSSSQQKVDTFMKVFNSKNESAIEAYPVLQNYASKIFGRDTKVQISITDNNSMVDIVMYREGNEIMYLVKNGNGDFQLRENIDDINILKTISVYP